MMQNLYQKHFFFKNTILSSFCFNISYFFKTFQDFDISSSYFISSTLIFHTAFHCCSIKQIHLKVGSIPISWFSLLISSLTCQFSDRWSIVNWFLDVNISPVFSSPPLFLSILPYWLAQSVCYYRHGLNIHFINVLTLLLLVWAEWPKNALSHVEVFLCSYYLMLLREWHLF